MTVMGLMSRTNDTSYKEEVQRLANKLHRRIVKTKAMTVDPKMFKVILSLLSINGNIVHLVNSTKCLEIYIAQGLPCTIYISSLAMRAQHLQDCPDQLRCYLVQELP